MRSRRYLAALVAPIHICGLACAWLVPAAGALLTSERPSSRCSPAALVVLVALVAAAASALAARGVAAKRTTTGGRRLRWGLRLLGAVAPYGRYSRHAAGLIAGTTGDGSLAIRKPALDAKQTLVNEWVHLVSAALMVACGARAVGAGQDGVVLVCGGGLVVAVWCVMLQRYNRERLERTAARFGGRPNEHSPRKMDRQDNSGRPNRCT